MSSRSSLLHGSVDWNCHIVIIVKNHKRRSFTGAWIEISKTQNSKKCRKSRSFTGAWIEIPTTATVAKGSVTSLLHGSVDWNWNMEKLLKKFLCRSFTGAWIEIHYELPEILSDNVAPSRERGLKSKVWQFKIIYLSSLLHGSVDWNPEQVEYGRDYVVSLLHGSVDWN